MLCPGCKTVNAEGSTNCASCGRILRLEIGTLLAGRYEIQAVLGQGGMGTVYRAHDRSLDEPVAIKVLRPEIVADEAMARRFLAEIKTARKIAHRNVCRIHEYGEDHGLRFISMAYVEGVDLKHILRERGALPWDEGFEVAIRVAEALEAIHDEGIVHRDLKTPNIMRDNRGVVRVMDFGIAKDEAVAGMTQTGMIVGTPEYMSPEQATGAPLDFRADLYALGIVIFELFTGGLPFRGDTPMGTLMKQIQTPPPLDGPEAQQIPPALLPVLRRLLAKNSGERHATTHALVEDLKAARDATPGAATPRTVRAGALDIAGTPTPVPAATLTRDGVTGPTVAAVPSTAGPITSPPPLPLTAQHQNVPARTGVSITLVLGGLAALLLLAGGLGVAGFLWMRRGPMTVPAPASTPSAAAPATKGNAPSAPETTPASGASPASEASTTPYLPGEPSGPSGGANPPGTPGVNPQQQQTGITPPKPIAQQPGMAPQPGMAQQPGSAPQPGMAQQQPNAGAASRPSAQWTVAHDHGGAFRNFCIGTLYLEGGMLGIRTPQHSFQVPLSDIREVKRNDLYAIAYQAFHIKLKRGGQNFNLAAVNQAGRPVDPQPILNVLQMAR